MAIVQTSGLSDMLWAHPLHIMHFTHLSPWLFLVQESEIVFKYVLNSKTLPLISSIVKLLQVPTVFMKLDLQNAYHLVYIWQGDE